MERFAADPMASIPKASLGWSETVAAYRFFDNDSGRTCPELDAALFFGPDEIHGVYLLNDQDAPDKPRLNDVLRLVPPG